MRDVSNRNFGLLIAYLVPGVIGLWGLSYLVPDLRPWLVGPSFEQPTIGGFLYLTLGAVTLGMIASVVRWAVLDTVHHATGLEAPRWSDERLHERLAGYDWLVENHYRYYQFYGNTLISLLAAHALWRSSLPDPMMGFGWLDASVLILAGMLFAGSRSSLSRYYRRTASLLGGQPESIAMTNGGHPKPDPKKPEGKNPKSPGGDKKTK